jgi:hypothetical protein
LAALDPVSGHVVWQRPYSAVDVTPGVVLTPISVGNVVLDVSNTGKPKDELVLLSGINAETGNVVWHNPASFTPSDAPFPCAQGKYFCLPGYNSGSNTALLQIQRDGTPVRALNHPFRDIGPDLYQTDASKPTLEQLTGDGTRAWQEPVSALFGTGYSTDDGWDFNSTTSLDVGTVEPIVKGNGYDVSDEKTLGINLNTGATAWSLAAEYQCGGSLAFLSTQVACTYGGVTSKPSNKKKAPSYSGLTVALVGFDPDTGAVSWKVPIADVKAIMNGDGLPFLDDTHVVVTLTTGKKALLDTSNGTTSSLSSGEVLWCQKEPSYKVSMPKGEAYFGHRFSTPLSFGCDANGMSTTKLPSTTPATVGVTVDGEFVWASPGGLRTRVVGTPQSFA